MSEPSQPTPPPVAPVPPVPQYGEYAPAGYVPPVQPQAPAPSPEYGYPMHPAPGGGRRRKTWDLVLTVILLVVGFFGALIGVVYGFVFTQPDLLSDALAQQGYPDFNGDTGAVASVLIISHVVLYLLAVGGSLPLLITKRVAFWVPLAAGVIAAIFFWGCLTAAIASDPAFVSNLS
jgi:hypothetical protein